MKTLKEAMYIAAIFCLVTVGIFFIRAIKTIDGITNLTQATTGLVSQTQKDEVDANKKIQAILLHVDRTAGELAIASQASKRVSDKSLDVLEDADHLVEHITNNTDQITSHTVQALDSIPVVMKAVPPVLNAANDLISDPNIKLILSNVQATSVESISVMKHTDETMTHVSGIADDIHTKVDQMLKPASLVKRIATNALQYAASLKTLFF